MPGKKDLRKAIKGLEADLERADIASLSEVSDPSNKTLSDDIGRLVERLQEFRERVSPVELGRIGISLGRSDGIAKFFAFSFVNRKKSPLVSLSSSPFFGSGVYAIYYVGEGEKAYLPLSGTETPLYVGSADPRDPNAETPEDQGPQLFKRLKEHAKSIGRTELLLGDFRYRAAPIQSGMQGAVEDFMIRLFRPIWNKEIGICFGIGKHGDSSGTRRNKRSPWDTMHPGRSWAADAEEDQKSRTRIEREIELHLTDHPPVPDKERLAELLALD